jgi:mono/diheme cytochrome c family protein
MKKLTTLVILFVLGAASMVLADGKTDYNAKCAGCHGANANVQTEKAKALKMDVQKLALRTSKMSGAEMVAIIEEGKGKMPGFSKELTKEQAAAIADYIKSLGN